MDEWPNFLGNRPMVEALLSRLRHYCQMVRIRRPDRILAALQQTRRTLAGGGKRAGNSGGAAVVPWGDGKRTLTRAYMLFLARWARRLSWKETAQAFRTSWEKVFDAVEHVVTWGLEHRQLGQIDAIGVDEIQYAKGHKYLTLVYQIDLGITRLLWVGKERTIESFQGFLPPWARKSSPKSCSSARTCGSRT